MVARMWTGLGHRIWEKGSSLVTPPGKQLASLGAVGSWESRRYLLVEVGDGGLFGGGANGNGPDRGAPDDGGRGASGQRPLRRIPLLIPSLQRPLGQGIIQHGHRRHLLREKREGHPPGVTGWDREEGPCPPLPPASSPCPAALPWDPHVPLGIPGAHVIVKSIPSGITGCGVGILGHLPARQNQERVGRGLATQHFKARLLMKPQQHENPLPPGTNIPKSCWEP